MSKQICFFATQKDISGLLSQIYSLGALVVDYTGNPLTKQELLSTADYNCRHIHCACNNFLITKPSFSLSYRMTSEGTAVDQYVSEVIEFSLCTPVPQTIIDISSVDDEFRKKGIVIIDDAEKYDRLMKEVMANPQYIKNPSYVENGFEHGRFWYASTFFDSNGKIVKKSKAVDLLFKNLKMAIQKHFVLSKDKFAYIAPDAYAKYLSGSFIPCSGKNRIVF